MTVTTTAQLDRTMHHDGFTELVRDLLTEHSLSSHQLGGDDIARLVDRITEAYEPRIAAEREKTARAVQQTRTLVSRDKAMSAHIIQLQQGESQIVISRERYATQCHILAGQLSAISAVLRKTRAEGSQMISIAEIAGLVDNKPWIPPQDDLHCLSFVPGDDDDRSAGQFDGAEHSYTYALLGWASVLRARERTSAIEPVFLVDGQPAVQSELAKRGLRLRSFV